MSVAINPPKTPVTQGSSGIAAATLPNVCKMPGPPAPFVPTPLPNIGKSDNSPQGYSTTVTIGGNAVAIQGATFNSMGDVASQGTGGGIVSNNVQGPTSFVGPGSMDTKIEGKAVQLLSDQMLNNGAAGSGSPANSATMAGILQSPATAAFAAAIGDQEKADKLCEAACKAMNKKLKPGQTRQAEMAKAFTGNGPLYTPNNPDILPEVSQVIPSETGGGMTTLLSDTGRTVPGSEASAPMAMFKAMGQSSPESPVTRWDFIIPSDPSKAATTENIDKFVEVKFPGDKLTKNQEFARKQMTEEELEKVVEMHPERDCNCPAKE